MIECFDKAMFPKVPAQYALAEARYAYLWDRTNKGWSYVDSLMPVYFELKILDTTFLHIRGLPFFQEAWAYLAAFSQLDGDFERLTAYFKTASIVDEENVHPSKEAKRWRSHWYRLSFGNRSNRCCL